MFIEFLYKNKNRDNYYWLLEKTYLYLSEWSRRYQINFTKKVVKHSLRICFEHDKYYDFFMLTFDRELLDYYEIDLKLISDPNNRT